MNDGSLPATEDATPRARHDLIERHGDHPGGDPREGTPGLDGRDYEPR
jgi:hypothetical protein